MRILVENGCYDLRNMGDVGMLEVAVRRLKELWPGSVIMVVTDQPAFLARYCPGTQAVPACGRNDWLRDRTPPSGLRSLLPNKANQQIFRLWRTIRSRRPRLAQRLIQWNARGRKADVDKMDEYLEALFDCDLLIVSGGGDINDAFADYAMTVLEVMEMSVRAGITTVMFSQGIGPVGNGRLRAKAKAVLPSVDFIAIRDSRTSYSVLRALGVGQNRITATGDDAIELAYDARRTRTGSGIGVNLRAAEYSQVTPKHIETVRKVLQAAATKYNTELIGLPVCFQEGSSDVETIKQLLKGSKFNCDDCENLDSPERLAEKVGYCRVVVTGSYHSAVFALAEGIGAVALANSSYYKHKFLGLSGQFGCGCELVELNDRDLFKKIGTAIDAAWESADKLRPELLDSAKRQIACSRRAYERVYQLLESGSVKNQVATPAEKPHYAGHY